MSKFSLSPRLRAMILVDSITLHPLLGCQLPISVLERGFYSQSIKVFPQDGYGFFMGCEVARVYQLAKNFDLNVIVRCKDSLVYLVITDYID